MLYDFANIYNPEQIWFKNSNRNELSIELEKGEILINGIVRDCYYLGGKLGCIIEGIGYDGYGFHLNVGDLMCQFPALVTGTDAVPVFNAYKNAEGKVIYNAGDALNVFNGVENIEVYNNTPTEYYNLKGVKVANPQGGIFIKVQGNKATKELVK